MTILGMLSGAYAMYIVLLIILIFPPIISIVINGFIIDDAVRKIDYNHRIRHAFIILPKTIGGNTRALTITTWIEFLDLQSDSWIPLSWGE